MKSDFIRIIPSFSSNSSRSGYCAARSRSMLLIPTGSTGVELSFKRSSYFFCNSANCVCKRSRSFTSAAVPPAFISSSPFSSAILALSVAICFCASLRSRSALANCVCDSSNAVCSRLCSSAETHPASPASKAAMHTIATTRRSVPAEK